MTTVLPFSNNTINVELYQPFSYTISNPYPTTPFTSVVASSLVNPFVTNNVSNIVFASATGYSATVSSNNALILTVTDPSFGQVTVSSNTINYIRASFKDASGNTLNGQSFVFYKNEALVPIAFNSPIPVSSPVSFPSLPAGLSFVQVDTSGYNYQLTGTPLVELPNSNYFLTASAIPTTLGRTVTANVNMMVNSERVILDVSGTTLKSNMTVGTPITSTVITARYPSQSSSNLQYTWGNLPSGVYFSDCNGFSQASGFRPTDASSTLILQGTPNLTAASNFAALGISSNTITLKASRVSLPTISNTENFTFSFGETVLFDTPSIQTLYVGVSVSSSATSNSYRARTYFAPTDVSITNITAASLPAGLSLTFVSNDQRAYLSGTPTTASSSSYTITAVNANFVTRDLTSSIVVSNDTITFDNAVTAATDLCVNFILSRPVTAAKTGYYPASILFRATAASGCNVVFSAPGLAGTGLTLSNLGNNTVQIVGIPEVVQPLSNLSVIASAVGTPATASRDISFSIIDDVFTFTTSPSGAIPLIQNVAMTPVQISTTTLSERTVVSYAPISIPAGMSISTTGKITGSPTVASPTSGTISWVATTGYTTGTGNVAYSLTPDSVIIVAPEDVYTYNPGNFVSIPIQGITYSGIAASNYVTDLSAVYGLSIDSSTGIFSGTLMSGERPGPTYPTSPVDFTIDASASTAAAQLQATLDANNPIRRSYVSFRNGRIDQFANVVTTITSSDNLGYSNWITSFSVTGTVPMIVSSSGISNVVIIPARYTRDSNNSLSNSGYVYSSAVSRLSTPPVTFNEFVFPAFSNFYDPILSPIIQSNRVFYPNENSNGLIGIDTTFPVAVDISGNGPICYLAAACRWYGGLDPGVGAFYMLFESTNYGNTWTPITTIGYRIVINDPENPEFNGLPLYEPIISRGFNDNNEAPDFPGLPNDPYYIEGLALGVKDGIVLVGGITFDVQYSNSLLRNDGVGFKEWTQIDTSAIEISSFSLEESGNWLMGGSDTFLSREHVYESYGYPVRANKSIWRSGDKGITWTPMSNAFTVLTRSITYGNGVWVATGLDMAEDYGIPPGEGPYGKGAIENVRYFVSGVSTQWEPVDLSGSTPALFGVSANGLPLRVGPVSFDGSNWNIFARIYTGSGYTPTLFRHAAGSNLSTGWVATQSDMLGNLSNATDVVYGFTPSLRYGGGNVTDALGTVRLIFSNAGSGIPPTLTSPTNNKFVFYEYIAITPIQLSATGTGNIYFFVATSQLPQGLTFNPVTNIISGTPSRIGTFNVNVVVKDDLGFRSFGLTFNIVKPFINKRQDTASAYTSYLRQYTVVNAAQNAIGNRVLNVQESHLGEFMAPSNPPDIIPATVDPSCFSTSNCS